MAGSPSGATGRIFISYRREETAYPAGWLYDRLVGHFGRDQVFKDVDSIDLGDDFPQVIADAVGSCDVLLALVGDRWLTITDRDGTRRLDRPDDFVRLEIEAALQRNVRLIPVLVDGATMPPADELPPSLAGMTRRQALELSPSRFEYDINRLLRVLDETLAGTQRPPGGEKQAGPQATGAARSSRHPPRGATAPAQVNKAFAAVAVLAVVAIVAVIIGLLSRDGGVASGDETAASGTSPSRSTAGSTKTTRRSESTATTQALFRGFILRRPSLEFRAEPKLSAPVMGYLPYNTPVYIVCTTISDPVTGPGRAGGAPITTRVWDKVRTERDGDDLGFVPDAFVKTGTTDPVAGAC
jgi:TIR domain